MKLPPLLLIVTLCAPSYAQVYKTPEELNRAFNEGWVNGNPAMMLSTLRSAEMKGLSPKSIRTFWEIVIRPMLQHDSLFISRSGQKLKWLDQKNTLQIVFRPTGGCGYAVLDSRPYLFKSPVMKDGTGYKSTVTIGQLMFSSAAILSSSSKRNMIQEWEDGQKLVESWIPKIAASGIKGTIDPETNRFNTWKVVITQSRAEIELQKRRR
jgi:hypothetical protein